MEKAGGDFASCEAAQFPPGFLRTTRERVFFPECGRAEVSAPSTILASTVSLQTGIS
jgi:hypothetical protein